MSDGINIVILSGHLGADGELRRLQNGDPVLRLRLATSKSYFDKAANERKDKVSWHSCVVWGGYGEALAPYAKKGAQVTVHGSLETRSYEKDGAKQYATNVVATNVIIGKNSGSGQSEPHERTERRQAQPAPQRALPHTEQWNQNDDDMPF